MYAFKMMFGTPILYLLCFLTAWVEHVLLLHALTLTSYAQTGWMHQSLVVVEWNSQSHEQKKLFLKLFCIIVFSNDGNLIHRTSVSTNMFDLHCLILPMYLSSICLQNFCRGPTPTTVVPKFHYFSRETLGITVLMIF